MVCSHCVEAVARALDKAGVSGAEVSLGGAEFPDIQAQDAATMARIDSELEAAGFQRITGAEAALVERAKIIIIKHVRNATECHLNLSACLSDNLNTDYSLISKIFSAREGRTIEKYAIAQRIEYVKELLSYRQLNITEIADITGYSSVAHLSRQFKSITGLTPSAFIKAALPRIPLNKV